ncbi:hypothetical protein KJ596_00560 [Patescibacteria group bacterium]|nr:hypothetical protein [Patescibacteria group bacterium]MBU1867946.1 hypothetical protein [Patescibacteria group bacterium]
MPNPDKTKIGVIFGGLSSENEVSLATGRYIFSLLDPQQHESIALYLDRFGKVWQIQPKLVLQNTTADIENKLKDSQVATRVEWEQLSSLVDLIFIALLGKVGEDGTIQGIFELLDIPYTGSGILSSAIGMNKKVHKKIINQAGIAVARDITIRKTDWDNLAKRKELAKYINDELQFPVIIKPVAEGSSIGVTKVNCSEDLDHALMNAFQWDSEALAEEFITGHEFMCVVWGNRNPQAMSPTQVQFEGDIYTYEGKYMPGKTKTITPAPFEKDTLREIQETAVKVYEMIGIQGYGRVDGWVTNDQERDMIIIGEPHTGTIMVPSSYIFQQAAKFNIELKNKKVQTGMSPRTFVSEIIRLAKDAHGSKKQML